jgi:two-component system sensor histidine kinase KdpD
VNGHPIVPNPTRRSAGVTRRDYASPVRLPALADYRSLEPRFARPTGRELVSGLLVVALALGAASLVVALLESPAVGMSDASPVYLVPVVIAGLRYGIWGALGTAVAAFLLYDLVFTEPRFSFSVADPREWLDILLFLFVAIVVGRLAALGTERAQEAARRAAESTSLFAISRLLATAPDLESAGAGIVERLVRDVGLERAWIVTDRSMGPVVIADSSPGHPLPSSPFSISLIRTPGDLPAKWVKAHDGSGGGRLQGPAPSIQLLKVRMEADEQTFGWLRAQRPLDVPLPSREETRLLALAADQLALALRREDLRRAATETEIARESDALKSALLDAVSHDLRTPLASIRAAAGTLVDPDLPPTAAAARHAGTVIELEATRLDQLVRDVLDLSRIEGGGLRPELEALDLRDVVEPVVERLRPALGERDVRVTLPDDLPPVAGDAVLLDAVVSNLVENAARHAPSPAAVAISAHRNGGTVELRVDDGGPGVPDDDLERLFDKFFRVERAGEGSRRGMGIGLAVVRGLTESMGGRVAAERSPLGGLRVVVDIPVASDPPRRAD